MCASSSAKWGEKNVRLYMGYYGGKLTIGDIGYKQDAKKDEKKKQRRKMRRLLMKHTAGELTSLILGFVDNSVE